MIELRCQACHHQLNINSEESYCNKPSCQRVMNFRQDLTKRIADYTDFFKGKTPDESTYREYLEMAGLEEKYRMFAGLNEENDIPKCSRRVWFSLNVSLNHHDWPDETGKLRHTNDA